MSHRAIGCGRQHDGCHPTADTLTADPWLNPCAHNARRETSAATHPKRPARLARNMCHYSAHEVQWHKHCNLNVETQRSK